MYKFMQSFCPGSDPSVPGFFVAPNTSVAPSRMAPHARVGSRKSLCINDEHLHSTPLAGVVGAHMIYRAVFGEVPPKTNFSEVSYSHITAKLDDYYTTGMVKNIPSDSFVFDD